MDTVCKVCAVFDIPYEFKDEKGVMRKGVTRKACIAEFAEYDSNKNTCVTSVYVAKCSPDCELPIGTLVYLDYDKYGRVRSSRPVPKN